MKTNFLLIFAFFLLFSLNAQTNKKVAMTGKNTQVSEWNKVHEFENQSLPKSALEVVNRIYQNALKDGNSPELIKSMIYKLKFETAIDWDRFPQLIKTKLNRQFSIRFWQSYIADTTIIIPTK